MEFIFIIENEKGILKNKEGKEIQFDTEAEALNYIDEHNVKNAVVRMDYAEDIEEENNMEFEESRYEKLKKALWSEGKDAIENFCDVTLSGYENSTAIDNLIDDAIDQMPDDVFDEYYKQYVKEEE